MTTGGLLRQRIDVLTAARVSNGAGGWTNAYTPTATVNGRLYQGGLGAADEIVVGDAVTVVETAQAIVDLSGDVTLTGGCRVRDDKNVEYEVLAVDRQGDVARLNLRRL